MKLKSLALLSGSLFGLGMCVSRMADPEKVINFLDVTGNWDPSLMLVMIGALLVTTISFRFILKREGPFFDTHFRVPTMTDIDKKLLFGASLFGIGWGMIGYCPGPAVTALGFGLTTPAIAVIAMIAGFMFHKLVFEKEG